MHLMHLYLLSNEISDLLFFLFGCVVTYQTHILSAMLLSNHIIVVARGVVFNNLVEFVFCQERIQCLPIASVRVG